MKVKNINFKSLDELRSHLFMETPSLIQVFSGLIKFEEIEEIRILLNKKFPGIPFIGTTTAGEIHNGTITEKGITLSLMKFEATTVDVKYFEADDPYSLGITTAKEMIKDDTKALIVFVDGLFTNGNNILNGISSVNNTIPIAGGMAGDNGLFQQTYVFTHEKIIKQKGLVCASLNSEILNVITEYQLNWQPIGKTMTVTKVEDNRLYELDGEPLADVYRKYLGDQIGDGLPHSAIEFPLIKTNIDGIEICRTFVHLFDDGSLLTIGNLELGDQVSFAFGNIQLILNNTKHNIEEGFGFDPECIYTYSCAARVTFLQNEVVMELEPLEKIAPIAGFFTYGEIFHKNGKNHLLNISLTLFMMSEKEINNEVRNIKTQYEDKEVVKNFFKGKHFLVLDALTHLSNQVISELNEQQKFVQTLIDSQEQIIITTNGKKINSCNKKFLEFFNIDSLEQFTNEYNCICDKFIVDNKGELLQKNMDGLLWIKYIMKHKNSTHKVAIVHNDTPRFFTVDAAILPIENNTQMLAVFTDITELEKTRTKIETLLQQTRSSIEYASLIQNSLIPSKELFKKYFVDHCVIWEPKDIVGGDIYLLEELRNDDECLIMVIDCTGHGVPGAFVTMLVKAIERQVAAIISTQSNKGVSPAWILNYFNKTIKTLLKQESNDAISNAGFDGGIFYYNKKEKIVKFSGAETSLFYIEDDELKTIKGNRHSIGYKKSDINYQFTEHTLKVKEGMKFYLSTDGYLDQNGGKKGFCLGKRRFKEIIENSCTKQFKEQEQIFRNELLEYQGKWERNDDITVIGLEI